MTEKCSTAIQNILLTKFKDLDSFFIPCLIGNVYIDYALCDLGSSATLMPHSICKIIDLGELRPTTASVQLVVSYVKYLVGVLQDLPIKVGDLYVPVDFVNLEMKEDTHAPSFLGGLSWPLSDAVLMSRMVSCPLMWETIIWSSICLRLLNFQPCLMSVIGLMSLMTD